MFKRPQRGESEEDLLRIQEEYFKQKAEQNIQPAAKFVSAHPQQEETEDPKPDIEFQISNTFEEIPTNANVGCIVERTYNDVQPINPPISFNLSATGFPVAKRRDANSIYLGSSRFSQNKKMKTAGVKEAEQSSTKKLPSESFILTGNDKKQIHEENVNRLNKMTEEEILEEQQKLLSTMDPAIVAYLKDKRKKLTKKEALEKMSDAEKQMKATENLCINDLNTVQNILTQPKSEKWIHFDKMETAKLAWMKDINIKEEHKKEGYEARFDFGGWLLPYDEMEMNEKNRVLYHHGDEPNRPGYTLQELFQLARSNVMQQKVTALNSIANIVSLETSGIYDDIINIPIEQIFFVLRFCMDENTPIVLNACVKAIRNLFYYSIDEASVDSLLGFGIYVQPSLYSEDDDDEDDKTVNDQQLAEKNLVKCLARAEIFTRIRYIINMVKPSLETIVYVLEILIRLSRDSLRIANLIIKNDDLIRSIFKHFVPMGLITNESNLNYSVPLKQAIKLCRVLSARSVSIAETFITKYNVMDALLLYLSSEKFSSNTNGVQLQTECLHLWNVFVSYGLTIEKFKVFEPVLMQILHFHIKNTNLSSSYSMQGHFAALMNLLSSVAKYQYDLILPYLEITLNQGLKKWLNQFNSLTSFLCGKLLIVSSLLNFISSVTKYKSSIDFANVHVLIKLTLKSNGFQVVTNNIKVTSNLLCPHEPHKPTKNILSAEAAVWNASEHIIPVLQTNSCLPFLNCLSNLVANSDDDQLKLLFLSHENVQSYLSSVKDGNKYNMTSNWFTTIESGLIANILKISHSIHRSIDTSVYYIVAVKCLCVFNSQQKEDVEYLFKNIIFNKDYYPGEILLRSLNISEDNSFTSDCLSHLDDIFKTYIEVLGLKREICADNLTVDVKVGNIIPVDWIYSPIVVLYSNSQKENAKLPEEVTSRTISNCLRWVYIYETYFSDLSLMINATDKYCRLACVFLASDDVFFTPAVHRLLEMNLLRLVENDLGKLDFKRSVRGLSSFQDFYTQLLEQYQGVSYGDSLFGNFILVPLMQKANPQYRKLFWSEYFGITQVLNVTRDNLLMPMEIFLEPKETDLSVLKCYRRYMLGRPVPDDRVLKIICKHHLDNYIKNKQQ